MTPDEQVKEIVKMLNPENPSTTDAVFLVQRYMQNALEQVSARDKRIALLEAELEAERGKTSTVTNEKLAKEVELKSEIGRLKKGEDKKPIRPPAGGGRTL